MSSFKIKFIDMYLKTTSQRLFPCLCILLSSWLAADQVYVIKKKKKSTNNPAIFSLD